MNKFFNSLFVGLLMTSCHIFGPVDNSIKTKNVDFSEEDIIGTWKLDKFSYDYVDKKEQVDSIYISFNKNRTFSLNNSGDLLYGKVDNLGSQGTWEILKMPDSKYITIKFNDDTVSNFSVYQREEEYQIWYFFGDADLGERLRFLKI